MRLISNYNRAFDNLLEFAIYHGFKQLYLFAGSVEWDWEYSFSVHRLPEHDFFVEQLKKLYANNIEVNLVVYLNDDVNNLANWERIKDVAETIKVVNEVVPVKTLHLDQEPSQPQQYEALINMLSMANSIYPTSSTVKPLWTRQKMEDVALFFSEAFNKTISARNTESETKFEYFVDMVINATDSSEMMAYSNEYAKIRSLSQFYVERTKIFGKPGTNIVETGFINQLPEAETLHYQFQKNPDEFFEFVSDMSKTYGTVVVHDYMQYYFTLYCNSPQNWVGLGPPKTCV
ncbi:Conserved_hypothetical protein [Hexamita inflata]|uniref:Uncharacterized protein n=1 Tax=Hexamita inflata TaxID=28002 RepID=A0AA86PS14_9EUKA|nr:Conserved hypothetical protein [Hexamita inflata]